MADMSNINLETLNTGIKSTKLLRTSVRELFKFLADGAISQPSNVVRNENDVNGSNESENDAHEKHVLNELASLVGVINNRLRDLESSCTLLAQNVSAPVHITLGNSGILSQDPNWERTPLYSSMVSAYRWSDRLFEHSSHASGVLTSNSLRRTNNPTSSIALAGRARPALAIPIRRVTYSVQQVDNFCLTLQRCFHDMTVDILRPFGSPALLLITLERVLKAVVLFRGASIEFVQVKGFNEDFFGDDGKVDIWSESRYLVFRKVTHHANAAMLHFVHPVHPELAVKSFLTWLHSYTTLFSRPCKKCDQRLQNNLPPTWRDVRNLDGYHEMCRP